MVVRLEELLGSVAHEWSFWELEIEGNQEKQVLEVEKRNVMDEAQVDKVFIFFNTIFENDFWK
jgi:hypothetical protein